MKSEYLKYKNRDTHNNILLHPCSTAIHIISQLAGHLLLLYMILVTACLVNQVINVSFVYYVLIFSIQRSQLRTQSVFSFLEDIKMVVYLIRNMAVLNKETDFFHFQILVKLHLRLQITRVRKMSSGKVNNIWGWTCEREILDNYLVRIIKQISKPCTFLSDQKHKTSISVQK